MINNTVTGIQEIVVWFVYIVQISLPVLKLGPKFVGFNWTSSLRILFWSPCGYFDSIYKYRKTSIKRFPWISAYPTQKFT